jgi:hypothetical protein
VKRLRYDALPGKDIARLTARDSCCPPQRLVLLRAPFRQLTITAICDFLVSESLSFFAL